MKTAVQLESKDIRSIIARFLGVPAVMLTEENHERNTDITFVPFQLFAPGV